MHLPVFEPPTPRRSAAARARRRGRLRASVTRMAGTAASGRDRFTWKPTSDRDGKVVVFHRPDVIRVELRDSDGRILEQGRAADATEAGLRRFRFTRRGDDYPPDLIVQVRLRNGSVDRVRIPDPSQYYQ